MFRAGLDAIFNHLGLIPPPGGTVIPEDFLFPAQLHLWGARNFDNDHQNPQNVNLLNGLRAYLNSQNLLTRLGIVSQPNTPDRSHGGDDDEDEDDGTAGMDGVAAAGGPAAVAH